MKGFADKPNYIIELLEGGVTLEDVIDGHICEQALVSSICRLLRFRLQWAKLPKYFKTLSIAYVSVTLLVSSVHFCICC